MCDNISLQNCAVGQQLEEVVVEDFGCPLWQDSDLQPYETSQHFTCFTGDIPLGPTCKSSQIGIDGKQGKVVQELAERGFSLGSVLELVCILLDRTEAFSIVSDLEAAYVYHTGIPLEEWPDLSFFDAATTTTQDVTYRCLIPLSHQRGCAFSKILTGHKKCAPKRMVSHTWNNVFLDTIAACIAAAQGNDFFFHIRPRLLSVSRVRKLMEDLGSETLETTFWMCAMSVNQHTVTCHESPWPCGCGIPKVKDHLLSEVGCFDLLLRHLSASSKGFEQVIAVDEDVRVDVEVLASEDGRKTRVRPKSYINIALTPSFRTSFSTLRTSLGTKSSSIWSCGAFDVDTRSRCVVSINESTQMMLSRRVFVGDVIESVNQKNFIWTTSSSSLAPGDIIKVRRKMSVTTRIWVATEIAEAHKQRTRQRVVSHFPMALSDPNNKRRILAANVLESEASKPSDVRMLLERSDFNADDYNKRLRRTLLATPRELKFMLAIVIMSLNIALTLMTALAHWQENKTLRALGYISFVMEMGMILWIFRFLLRYFWVIPFFHDDRICAMLRKEIRNEAEKHFDPWLNPIWTRPFLTAGFLWGRSWKRRLHASLLFFLIGNSPQLAAYFAGAFDEEFTPDCRDRGLTVTYALFQSMGFYLAFWAVSEQRAILRNRGAVTFVLLSTPMIVVHPAHIVLCTDSSTFHVMQHTFWRIVAVALAFDVFKSILFDRAPTRHLFQCLKNPSYTCR